MFLPNVQIPPYTFKVPDGWVEKPVSIADLGGTEIDVRLDNDEEGKLAIVVAPVLRFLSVGFNVSVSPLLLHAKLLASAHRQRNIRSLSSSAGRRAN